jgi:hypothetical protein
VIVAVILVGFLAVGLPFVLVGVSFLRRGRRHLATRAALRATPVRTVADVQAGQRAAVVGRAAPAVVARTDEGATDREAESSPGGRPETTPPGTFAAGVTGTPALAARYEVTEHRPDGDGGTDAHVVYETTQVVPFRLGDGTGSVAVDAAAAAVDPSDDHAESIGLDEGGPPPATIEAFVARTDGLDPAFLGWDVGPFTLGGRARDYAEWRIHPDDEVAVVGPVERDPDAPWGDSLVLRPADDDTDLVTNRSLGEQGSHTGLVTAGYLLAGAAMVVGPLAVLGYVLWETGAF